MHCRSLLGVGVELRCNVARGIISREKGTSKRGLDLVTWLKVRERDKRVHWLRAPALTQIPFLWTPALSPTIWWPYFPDHQYPHLCHRYRVVQSKWDCALRLLAKSPAHNSHSIKIGIPFPLLFRKECYRPEKMTSGQRVKGVRSKKLILSNFPDVRSRTVEIYVWAHKGET